MKVIPTLFCIHWTWSTRRRRVFHLNQTHEWLVQSWNADYSMYSTFLTASSGSVLFSRSNLLKRKDLCFSWLRLGLIRHRRSLRSSHLSSQVCHDSHRVTLPSRTLSERRGSKQNLCPKIFNWRKPFSKVFERSKIESFDVMSRLSVAGK